MEPKMNPPRLTHESDAFYQRFVEELDGPAYTCDMLGYLKHFNKAAADVWGVLPEIGKTKWCGSWKIYQANGVQIHLEECPMATTIRERRIVSEEVIVERPDGKRMNVLPHPKFIKDSNGTIVGAINILEDITALRTTEQHLRDTVIQNEELAYQNTETEKRASELITINTELEAFSYVSSHDLQAPLRKIKMLSDRLLKDESQTLSDKGKAYLSRIQSAASRMTQLIDDLLAFSRLSRADRKFENTDLNKIVDEVKNELKEIIEEKNVTLEYSALCQIEIIPFQFRQIMYNLISNALKFSKPDQNPHIIVTSRIANGHELGEQKLESSTCYCHISVSDNGIGFDPKQAEFIFNVFHRLHGTDQYAGTGVGLAIVKKVVDNHNGIINATGVVNKGAIFDIYIPVSQHL